MALSIKTDEADHLARELAAVTKESLTQAVTVALRERLERVRAQPAVDVVTGLRRLSVEYTASVVHDSPTAEQIIGYDEHGLPA
jgi:antitoxin VapB